MNTKLQGKLIILSGPSGVGKGTVREKLFSNKDLNLVYSISVTTRKPRNLEVDGIDYYFVSEEAFLQKIKNNEFLEYAKFVGNYYGTLENDVDEILQSGKNVILEIEVQGALQVMKKRSDAISIFMLPPDLQELERRIKGRKTETEKIINERLIKAKKEMAEINPYKYLIINDNLEHTVEKIISILKDEFI